MKLTSKQVDGLHWFALGFFGSLWAALTSAKVEAVLTPAQLWTMQTLAGSVAAGLGCLKAHRNTTKDENDETANAVNSLPAADGGGLPLGK